MLPASIVKRGLKDSYPLTYKYYYQLLSIAHKMAVKLRQPDDDVKQMVLLTATTAEKNYDPSKGKFLAYASTIAFNDINKLLHSSSISTVGKKVQRFIKEYREEHQEYPDNQTIAKALGVSEREVVLSFLSVTPQEIGELLSGSPFVLDEGDMDLEYQAQVDEMMSKGFSQLNDLQRLLVSEIIFQNKPKGEVAKVLGVTLDTVDETLEEALSILKPYVI